MTDSTQSTAVATKPTTNAVTSAMSLYDTDKFAHMQRMAKALQFGSMLPEAVRGDNPDECFSNLLVVFDMADRLKVTPIALAQTVSMVHGKMVLEGKLVQAAIQNILGFTLYPWWVGERGTDSYRIYLSDKPWDEDSVAKLQPGAQFFDRRVIDGSVAEWKTLDKAKQVMPAWKGTQSQNQLLYRGTREWARRYEPGIMLGVYTDDEITAAEERATARAATANVTLSALPTGFAKDPAPAQPAEAQVEDAVVEDLVEDAQVEDVTTEEAADPEQTSDAEPTAEDLQRCDDAFEGYAAAKEKADLEADEARKVKEMDIPKDKKPARKTRGQKTQPVQDDTPVDDGASNTEDPALDADKADDDHTPVDDAFPMKALDNDCPVEQFVQSLGTMTSWEQIKTALVATSRTDAWRALDPRDHKDIRKEVWRQMDALIQAGKVKFDFLNDLSAFRCWLEWYGETDGILGNWDVLVSMDHFAALDEESQKALQSAVNARVLELRGGVH